jgi:hypothetical protein
MCFHFAFTKSIFAIEADIGRTARNAPGHGAEELTSPVHHQATSGIRRRWLRCLSAMSSVAGQTRAKPT